MKYIFIYSRYHDTIRNNSSISIEYIFATRKHIWNICTYLHQQAGISWWRHQMETFSALLAICVGNSPDSGDFPAQRPVTRSFGAFFDLRPNERLSKQWWGWWFETQSNPLWRYKQIETGQPSMFAAAFNNYHYVGTWFSSEHVWYPHGFLTWDTKAIIR